MKATPDGTSWRVSFQLSAFSGQLLAFLAALVEFRREVVDRARGLGGLQVLQKGLPIGIAAFLAQFELALQQLDLHLKADDAADQAVGVTLGQLGEVVAGAGALKPTRRPRTPPHRRRLLRTLRRAAARQPPSL